MTLLDFKHHIESQLRFLTNKKLLIAISGGLDSVVLTHLCHKLDLNFALAHCNFNLRGHESDDDEDFVKTLASQLNKQLFIKHFSTEAFAKDNKLSIQMAARQLRYTWFNEIVKNFEFDYILTAHHLNDSLETFIVNLSRGTGLDGLTGIPITNKNKVRPLLKFTRTEIAHYAKANKIKWQEDKSNEDIKYLRNEIRHKVIPKLQDVTPDFLNNFETTLKHLNQASNLIKQAVNMQAAKIVKKKNNHVFININKLKKLNNTNIYLYYFLKDYGFTEWNNIYNLINAQTGKQLFSKTYSILKNRDHLIISKTETVFQEPILIYNSKEDIKVQDLTLTFKDVNSYKSTSKTSIYVDKDKLIFPLTLRRWQKGDVFYPFGMKGKKKVSKYLKDEKVSRLKKESIFVLTSENKMVWILGQRMDDRFRIDEKTKHILNISVL